MISTREPIRPNNFDLARLVLAGSVVFSHCYALSQRPELKVLDLDSRAAVEGFFVISGFLIFASLERSKSLRDYYIKRAKRILPGYWLSTIVCVVVAVAFSRAFHLGKFLLANLTFLNTFQPGVPGVFEGHSSASVHLLTIISAGLGSGVRGLSSRGWSDTLPLSIRGSFRCDSSQSPVLYSRSRS